MIASHPISGHRRLALAGGSTALICGLSLALVASGGAAQAVATDVPLATTAQFAVLAGAGITNTGPTTVDGDVGSFPTTSVTGKASLTLIPPGVVRDTGDGVVQGAKPDLVLAYDSAAGMLPPAALPADAGGLTLQPGVHRHASALQLTGTVTLDGLGDPASVFVIQVGSDFTTASTSSVALVNGAQACHVYWQVAGSATFGTGTSFKGNVLALTSITATTAATFEGRLLARNGAVTLDTNTITLPVCAPPISVITPPVTVAPTPVRTTRPAPTRTTPTRSTPTRRSGPGSGGDSGGGSDDEASGGSGGSGGSEGPSGSGGSGNGDDSSTGIPNTGGPSGLLVPLGVTTLVAGGVLVAASRRPRGVHGD